jgi:RND family efflux transporter MFP subunit
MTTRALQTLLVFVIVAALQACGGVGGAGSDAAARPPQAVRLVSVAASTGAESTTYSAVIAPNAQVDLAFRVSGYVVEVRRTKGADGRIRAVEPGAAVTTGLVLSRVRAIEYQAVVDNASKARLDVARAKVDAATAAVAAATQRATAAAAQLQEARIALGDTELRAPFDGILLERHVDVGALVTAGVRAFTVADLHLVKARFSVPDSALHMFRVGMPLPLTVDAFANEPLEGRVLSVAPAADPKARSFEITVAIDNPTMKLRSGMIAAIQVTDETTDRRQVSIPIDALVHDPARDQYLVYALEQKDGGATAVKAVHVRPGPLVGNQVSILDGLTVGQRIVASGANLLRPGDIVKEIQ